MFDIEKAIGEWRRQMLAAGVKDPNVLDELEGHLREEMKRQSGSGESVEQAFANAVQRIGSPVALQNEFAKASKGTRRQRLRTAFLEFLGIPPLLPDALTAGARETLELGMNEARGFHHHFVGTEHALLGLLDQPEGIVRAVLHRMGVDHQIVRSEIEYIVGPGPAEESTHTPPYTPRLKKALALAGSEARALNQTRTGPEHIFLGLIREGDGVAARVLKKLGVNIQKAREEILKESGR